MKSLLCLLLSLSSFASANPANRVVSWQVMHERETCDGMPTAVYFGNENRLTYPVKAMLIGCPGRNPQAWLWGMEGNRETVISIADYRELVALGELNLSGGWLVLELDENRRLQHSFVSVERGREILAGEGPYSREEARRASLRVPTVEEGRNFCMLKLHDFANCKLGFDQAREFGFARGEAACLAMNVPGTAGVQLQALAACREGVNFALTRRPH
jgi:hypothetical protein